MDDTHRFENKCIDGAVFHDCSAAGATFEDTSLCESKFVDVNLRGATFNNVDLSGVTIDDAKIDGLKIFGHDIQALIRAELRRSKSEGQVSFLEMGSSDPAATRAFFGKVFGWSCHDEAWLQTPSFKVGTHGDDRSPQAYVCFNVTDLDAAALRVRTSGGEAEQPTTEPGFGRFVNCRDPGGIRFGLHLAE